MNISVHKQIIDLLESSGTRGMTLNVSISYHISSPCINPLSLRNSLVVYVTSINELLNCF